MALMQISRKADYALRAALYLAAQDPGRSCSASEIAGRQNVPQRFLEKIIRDLMRRGLVHSKRGWDGGYALARPPQEITFREVIEAVEGPIAVNACMDPAQCCALSPRCTMIAVWSEVQRRVLEVFSRTTLADANAGGCRAPAGASSLSSAA